MIFFLSNNSFKSTQRATNTYNISLKILIMINEFTLFTQFFIRKFWILTKGLFFDIKYDVMIKK